MSSTYEPLYVQFLYLFNVERDYYECHEVLEELWLERGRPLVYQGLLQAAVALYHYNKGNLAGARKLLRAAKDKLEAYPNQTLGIDLHKLVRDCEDEWIRIEKGAGGEEIAGNAAEPITIRILDPNLEALVHKLG